MLVYFASKMFDFDNTFIDKRIHTLSTVVLYMQWGKIN